MEFTHPIQQFAANVPSLWEMSERQAQEWDASDVAMEALQPGDPNAETVLRGKSALLQSLVINYGQREWHLTQAYKIWGHAERVFGKGQLIFNKPAVNLGGNDGLHASRFHGMRLKYRHQGGL